MRYSTAVPVGQGGTSEVLKAWDETLGRFVALKLLRRADPSLSQRLLREARAQAKLEHPNICQIYEVGDQDGVPYIAMQYIDGEEIGTLAPRLSWREKVRAVATVAEAVHAAHRSGLVHRDLKPGNIMMERLADGTWKPYVLDFGLVGDASAPALTVTGQLLGTPAFMAPEQASGSRTFDRRTDVYGLGATLYDLLTGTPPFGDVAMPELFHKIVATEPTSLRQYDPTIGRDLETVVLKCLAKTPARRYATALAVADDLQRVLDGEPIAARPPSWSHRVGRRLRRNRAVVAVALAALATTAGAAGFGVHERWTSSQRAAAAQRFGAEVRDMEWLMRTGHLLPLHDIREQRREVEQRLDTLEHDMAALGNPARAPGHYALGRGFLAIGDVDRALPYLERAWEEGFRPPEAAYARGMALGEMYRRAMARARSIRDPAARQKATDDAMTRWRDPALASLDRGRTSGSAPADYVDALVAFHEQRWDESLAHAEAALGSTPWLYEAWTLRGEVYLMQATALFRAGDAEGAEAATRQAQAAFESAANLAPSWPAAHSGQCTIAATRMNRALNESRSNEVAALGEAGLPSCERATVVDPEASRGWMNTSDILRFWGLAEHRSGIDPSAKLARAVTLAERAATLAPKETRPLLTVADGYLEWGLAAVERDDAATRLHQAVEAYDDALDRDPQLAAALNNRGIALRHLARHEQRAGQDPSATLAATADSYRQLKAVMPNLRSLDTNIAMVLEDRASYAMNAGLDARDALAEAVAGARTAMLTQPDHANTHATLVRILSLDATDRITRGQDATALVAETLVKAEQTLALSPNEGNHFGSATDAMLRIARALVAAGIEPGETLTRGRQWAARYDTLIPERNGPAGRLARLELIEARLRLGRGEDPRPALERAARQVQRVHALEPDHATGHHLLGQVHLLTAEYRAHHGRDPRPSLDRAGQALQRALDERPSLGAATLDHVRAVLVGVAWMLDHPLSPSARAGQRAALAAADDRLTALGDRLATHPDRLAVRAELAWLQTRTAIQPATRSAASDQPAKESPEHERTLGRAAAEQALERAPRHPLALVILVRLAASGEVVTADERNRVAVINPFATWRLTRP